MFVHIINLKTFKCESKNFITGKVHVKKTAAQIELEQSKHRNIESTQPKKFPCRHAKIVQPTESEK